MSDLLFYDAHLKSIVPLTPEDDFRLGTLAQKGDTAARNELVNRSMKLALKHANVAHSRHHDIDLDDLLQAGMMGLLHAASKYDPTRARFSTYATRWVLNYIQREVDANGVVQAPERIQKKARKVFRALYDIERQTGIAPTTTELSDTLCMPVSTVEELLQVRLPLSTLSTPEFDREGDDGETDEAWADTLEDASAEPPEEVIDRDEAADWIHAALEYVPAGERAALCLYFGLDGVDPSAYRTAIHADARAEGLRSLASRLPRHLAEGVA